MTDLETIKRIAAISGLEIKESETENLLVIEKTCRFGDGFYWNSKEDFGDFIQELLHWQYSRGYNAASRW